MYYDPIVTSSPPRGGGVRRAPASDSSDELAAPPYITQPTQPYNPPALSHPAHAALPSMATQPTQPITTTPPRYRDHVQVARSSPAADYYSSPPMHTSQYSQRPMNLMAPPGTYTLPPAPVPRPSVVDLTSDDPPVDPDSQEEDFGGSNIRPSAFEMQSVSRVQETPEKQPLSFGNLAKQYGYRANINANNKRPVGLQLTPPGKKKVRQSGPARAMPVVPELALEEIQDWTHQKLVRRLQMIYKHKTIRELYDCLLANGADYDKALKALKTVEMESSEEDELATSQHFMKRPGVALPRGTALPKGVAQSKAALEFIPKKSAQRGLNAPVKSIQEKFTARRESHAQPQPQAQSPHVIASPSVSPQKPKRRLIRGPRGKPVADESDEDEGINAISDDESSEANVSETEELDQSSLLKFFNECSTSAMVDLSNLKEEDIQSILDKRPFQSFSEIEDLCSAAQEAPGKNGKKARKPKITFGKRLVDAASNMWTGFGAVDKLVKQCEARGKPIVSGMAKWGVDVFGAAKDGEVALTSLETDSTRDSGLGTPSGAGTPNSTRDSDASSKLSKAGLIQKPSVMSPDIQLKDYQLVGLNWLNLLWQNQVSGILADDMGLGKTCQVISFLSHLWEQKVPGPHLIVVPGSTLENWLREFGNFSPKLSEFVMPYHGSLAERFTQQEEIFGRLKEDIPTYAIVTTYDIAFRKEDNRFLRQCKPVSCIYDEGHVLRNSETQRYKTLMKIPATFRLLLTGTPLQNSLRELASILAFIMPDIFNDVHDDLKEVFKHKAKVNENSHDSLLSAQRIERARSMMAPFILRRKKAQVLKHLPEKTCRVEYCELTPLQQKLYNQQLEQQKKVLLDRANGIQTKDHANVMMKLRQAAIHPLLFRTHYPDRICQKIARACLREEQFANSSFEAIVEDLTYYKDHEIHALAEKYPQTLSRFRLVNNEWMDSGKVKKLIELLKKYIANGDRCLLFSQFTSVMDILGRVFEEQDIEFSRFDGSTPIGFRQELIDQFHDDENIKVFMLSTKSGGAGINLACANKVIIFDSSFNPQDDVQAENRAHRVGQTRDVEVVRLVSKGTVEEQIHALGVSKLELDKMVSGEDGETEKPAAKGKKNEAEGGLSKAEEKGIEAVEDMLMEELRKQEEEKAKEPKKEDSEKAETIPELEKQDGEKVTPKATVKGKKEQDTESMDLDKPTPKANGKTKAKPKASGTKADDTPISSCSKRKRAPVEDEDSADDEGVAPPKTHGAKRKKSLKADTASDAEVAPPKAATAALKRKKPSPSAPADVAPPKPTTTSTRKRKSLQEDSNTSEDEAEASPPKRKRLIRGTTRRNSQEKKEEPKEEVKPKAKATATKGKPSATNGTKAKGTGRHTTEDLAKIFKNHLMGKGLDMSAAE